MSSWGFASRFTRMTFSAVDIGIQVADGEPVRVWGFIVTNKASTSNSTLTVRTADGATILWHYAPVASTTTVMDVPFIADKGISCQVTGGTNPLDIEITFFHSHPGT